MSVMFTFNMCKPPYPAISSAKYYLLIWRPDEARNGTLLNKLVANRLLV